MQRVTPCCGAHPPAPGLPWLPRCRSSARIAYYQQAQVEEMRARPQATALAYMQERWPAEREQALRNHLGSFGVKGATAMQPLATLSGALGGRRIRGRRPTAQPRKATARAPAGVQPPLPEGPAQRPAGRTR